MIQLLKRSERNKPSDSTTDAASPFSADLVSSRLIHLTIVWTIGYPVAAYLFLKRSQADLLNVIYISSLLFYLIRNYQHWDAALFDEGSIANLMIFLVTVALLLRHYNKVLNDAAESLKQKNSELERLSITDKLTGLYNRTKIDQSLTYELSRYIRSGQSFALILGDVDHFKAINDHLVHQKGDQALVHLAQILQSEIRSIDILGRWGGEEFVIICPNTEAPEALALANRLREQLKVNAHPELGWIKMSFGISGSLPGDTVDSILQRANRALYQAKTEGRDRVIMAESYDIFQANPL